MCRSAYVVDVVDVVMPVGEHAGCQNARTEPGGVIRRFAGSGRRASGAGGVRGRGAQAGALAHPLKLSNWATASNSSPAGQ